MISKALWYWRLPLVLLYPLAILLLNMLISLNIKGGIKVPTSLECTLWQLKGYLGSSMQVDDMILSYCVHIIWFHNAIHSALMQHWRIVFLHGIEFPVIFVYMQWLCPPPDMQTNKGVISLVHGIPQMAKWVSKEATIQSSWRPSLRGISSQLHRNHHGCWISINTLYWEFMISVKDKDTNLQMFPSLPCQWSLSFRLLGRTW